MEYGNLHKQIIKKIIKTRSKPRTRLQKKILLQMDKKNRLGVRKEVF